MTRKVLITDSLFIFDEHIAQLKAAGLEPIRLDKVKASEEELVEYIKDCEGYILGGVEEVTEPVIRAGGALKAICFTGSDHKAFIPAHALATEHGIAITHCPGANAGAVAEFTLTLILMMARRIPSLITQGGRDFIITNEFCDLTAGIIGYGFIGKRVAFLLKALGFNVVISTRSQGATAKADGFNVVDMDTLVTRSDIISIHVNRGSIGLLSAAQVNSMKIGSVLINTCAKEVADIKALEMRIANGEVLYASDGHHAHINEPKGTPIGHYISVNPSSAYNTHRANKIGSDWVTESLINLLNGRDDKYVVNPDYKKNRKAA